jgi:hypothetical protein
MTLQAFPAKVHYRLSAAQLNVGIVTRDAVQLAVAVDRAPAHLYLFGMAKRFDVVNVCCHWRAEDGNHVIERRPRPEVHVSLAGPQYLRVSEKVALLAHVIAKLPGQASRINYREINGASERCILSPFADVEFSGPMTPFTAYCQKTEGRDLIPISCAEDGTRLPGMAGNTEIPGGSRETQELAGIIPR